MQWNRSEYSDIPVIRLPAEIIWKPDIILYNNADKQYSSGLTSTNAIVSWEGKVTWLSSAIFKSSCEINVEYFPFDEQSCTMKFASWTYDGDQVNLVNSANMTDLSNYVANGEWDLVEASVKRNVVFYSCCEEPYPDVTYIFTLRRRPLFYGRLTAPYIIKSDLKKLTVSFQPDPAVCPDHWYRPHEFLHAL